MRSSRTWPTSPEDSGCLGSAKLGVRAADIPVLVAESRGSSMRTNPIVLDDAEIAAILADAL